MSQIIDVFHDILTRSHAYVVNIQDAKPREKSSLSQASDDSDSTSRGSPSFGSEGSETISESPSSQPSQIALTRVSTRRRHLVRTKLPEKSKMVQQMLSDELAHFMDRDPLHKLVYDEKILIMQVCTNVFVVWVPCFFVMHLWVYAYLLVLQEVVSVLSDGHAKGLLSRLQFVVNVAEHL
jgi:hypothetical protein